MVNVGAAAIVLRDHEVLLVKREDFEVWAPPGGAINGVGGSAVWSQDALWPTGLDSQNRQVLYDQRDQSGLSRTEFYDKHLGQIGEDGEERAI